MTTGAEERTVDPLIVASATPLHAPQVSWRRFARCSQDQRAGSTREGRLSSSFMTVVERQWPEAACRPRKRLRFLQAGQAHPFAEQRADTDRRVTRQTTAAGERPRTLPQRRLEQSASWEHSQRDRRSRLPRGPWSRPPHRESIARSHMCQWRSPLSRAHTPHPSRAVRHRTVLRPQAPSRRLESLRHQQHGRVVRLTDGVSMRRRSATHVYERRAA